MKIRVEIKSGSNLPNAEWFTKSDPYCICEVPLGDSGPQQLTEQLRTKTVKNSLDPDWNFSQECDWDGENNLVFKVYDKDMFTPDDYLGRVEITRDEILGGMTLDDRPLEGRSGTVHRPGQIGPSLVVEVHYKILAGEGQTVRIDPRRGKIDYDAKAKVPMIKLKVALADGNWQVGARMRSSVVGAAMRSSACCKEPPCELAWCSSRGPRTEESQVQYNDAQGRTCLIKKNTAGNLDFFINNKLKVKQLKEVCIGIDHTVYFDGQKIAFPDSCSKVTEKNSTEKDRVIQEIRTLAGACQVMTNKKRCFVKVISGKGLRAADIGGKSDPYVICGVPGKEKSKDQTSFKSRILTPTWNEILEIDGWASGDPLEFMVMDHDYMSADDFLGYAKLEGIDAAMSGHPPEQDLKLVDDKKHGAAGKDAKGSIKVQVFIGGSESTRPQPPKPKEAEESPHDKKRREMVDEVFKALSTSSLDMAVVCSLSSRKQVSSMPMQEGHRAGTTLHQEHERFPQAPPAAAGDDKIGFLQVRRLGQLLGFHCEPEAWKTEFNTINKERHYGDVDFWTRKQFREVLDRKLCTDAQLEKVRTELRNVEEDTSRRLHVVADKDSVWKPRKATLDELAKKPRRQLIGEIFRDFDTDADKGHLSHVEMKRYAELCGFRGTDDEWTMEWAELCLQEGIDAKEGIDEEAFAKLVENQAGSFFSDDSELRMCSGGLKKLANTEITRSHKWELREKTKEVRKERPKEELQRVLFDTLDDNKSGGLNPAQLRKLAELCGFEGDNDDWSKHYGEICQEYNVNPTKGATFEQFCRLLDKKAGLADSDNKGMADMIDRASLNEGARRPKLAKQRTWQDTSPNYNQMREFCLWLRAQFQTCEEAWLHFVEGRPLGRLAKETFLDILRQLEHPDEEKAKNVWRLMTLGSTHLVQKHFKYIWLFVETEENLRSQQEVDRESQSVLDEEDQQEDPIVVEMCVQGVDYGALSQNESLKAGFEGAIEKSIASEANINQEHVCAELSAGSVIATSTITPPPGVSSKSLASGLEQSKKQLSEEVLRNVSSLPGIDTVTVGEIGVEVRSVEVQQQEEEDEEGTGTKAAPPASQEDVQTDTPARRRHEVTDAIFRALATDGGDPDGDKVDKQQVRKLGQLLGFHGAPEVWEEEYDEICSELQCQNTGHLNRDQFTSLIDDDLCTDKQVNDVYQELRSVKNDPQRKLHIVASVWQTRERTKATLQKKPHAELVGEVFRALDTDAKQGFLSHVEMKMYAELCGFRGSDDEWKMEWATLCHENGVDAKEGIDETKFGEMVSQKDFLSDDDELRMCLGALQPPGLDNTQITRSHTWELRDETFDLRSKRPKEELVKILFDTLDHNESGRLQQDELRELARLCKWEGTVDEWGVEYGEMCHRFNIDPKSGATYEQFKHVLNEKAGMQDAGGAEVAALISKKISKQRTWTEASQNYLVLRDFSLFLRKLFGNTPETAWNHFVGNVPLARLSRDDFMQKVKALNFDGKAAQIWNLLALGSEHLVIKHFKFVYGLMQAEEVVKAFARMNTRQKESLEESVRRLDQEAEVPADNDASRPGASQPQLDAAHKNSQFSDAPKRSSLSEGEDKQEQVF